MNAINPWATTFSTANGEPIPANFKFDGQSGHAVASNGEINASNVADALKQISKLISASSAGQIKRGRSTPEQQRERRAMLAQAYSDMSGKHWVALGATMAEQIKQQAAREGFMRRLLLTNPLDQGQHPTINVHDNTAVAVMATSMSEIEYQQLRAKTFYPPEFNLIAHIMVDNKDIQQVSGDLLEQAYNDGLESVMIGEDRRWKALADATIGMENPPIYVGGQLTPTMISQVRSGVNNWNLPVSTMLMASNLWDDIVGNPDFHTLLNEIHRYDLVLNGQIGTILGMEIITDAFRNPNQKVLNSGELYAVASPEYHGGYTDRGGVVATPVDGAQNGQAAKGWFLTELLSMAVVNPRSVSYGRRI